MKYKTNIFTGFFSNTDIVHGFFDLNIDTDLDRSFLARLSAAAAPSLDLLAALLSARRQRRWDNFCYTDTVFDEPVKAFSTTKLKYKSQLHLDTFWTFLSEPLQVPGSCLVDINFNILLFFSAKNW